MFVCSVAQVEEWNREIECAFLKRAQRDNDDRTSFSSDYDYSKMQEGLGNKKEEDGWRIVLELEKSHESGREERNTYEYNLSNKSWRGSGRNNNYSSNQHCQY